MFLFSLPCICISVIFTRFICQGNRYLYNANYLPNTALDTEHNLNERMNDIMPKIIQKNIRIIQNGILYEDVKQKANSIQIWKRPKWEDIVREGSIECSVVTGLQLMSRVRI